MFKGTSHWYYSRGTVNKYPLSGVKKHPSSRAKPLRIPITSTELLELLEPREYHPPVMMRCFVLILCTGGKFTYNKYALLNFNVELKIN